ncbi:unnamed protein product, partial [Ilex paraguariensis]
MAMVEEIVLKHAYFDNVSHLSSADLMATEDIFRNHQQFTKQSQRLPVLMGMGAVNMVKALRKRVNEERERPDAVGVTIPIIPSDVDRELAIKIATSTTSRSSESEADSVADRDSRKSSRFNDKHPEQPEQPSSSTNPEPQSTPEEYELPGKKIESKLTVWYPEDGIGEPTVSISRVIPRSEMKQDDEFSCSSCSDASITDEQKDLMSDEVKKFFADAKKARHEAKMAKRSKMFSS